MPPTPVSSPDGWLERVIIRHLVKTDLPALEWGGEYSHFRRLYAGVYQSHFQGKAVMWVTELPGAGLIGQLFVQLTSSRPELADGTTRAYIYGFRIKPAFRGYGLGTTMMQVVENDLRRRNFHRVCLNVNRENEGALRLYEKLGYRVVAAEPGQWSYIDDQGKRQDVSEPAWRMEKLLDSHQ